MLTLKHKENNFDVSIIVLESKSVAPYSSFISQWKSVPNKTYFWLKLKDGQCLSEFSDCFGEIGTLNNTHHIEINDNVAPVVTPVRKILFALKAKTIKGIKMYDWLGYDCSCPKYN